MREALTINVRKEQGLDLVSDMPDRAGLACNNIVAHLFISLANSHVETIHFIFQVFVNQNPTILENLILIYISRTLGSCTKPKLRNNWFPSKRTNEKETKKLHIESSCPACEFNNGYETTHNKCYSTGIRFQHLAWFIHFI